MSRILVRFEGKFFAHGRIRDHEHFRVMRQRITNGRVNLRVTGIRSHIGHGGTDCRRQHTEGSGFVSFTNVRVDAARVNATG
jgi:hypothetical protein